MSKNVPKVCEVCGTVFKPRKSDVRTCSPRCKRELLSRKMAAYGQTKPLRSLPSKRCMACGETFEPSSGNQLTCSAKCSSILRRRRAADRKQAAQLEPIQFLPLHVAEDICRKLGMSYGVATAEALSCGLPLSQYLICMASKNGITIYEEGEHDSA